ncbi:hypothetical protein [Curtobacterium sp. PhB115]|uniref:hypothetical protein n=1 Tax=Curtobacterium sp. PhB115 TaxID=2485173 RepID=UPI000F4C2DE7|nr:hypothetical protein [Curtobacterium sp. PhB115]ROP66917.1 hypothetical protein EDF19_2263 [Curtobacterium sp. PhB115]
MITAEDLLTGPRGRRFCLELLRRVQPDDDPAAAHLGELLFWAVFHLGQERGDGGVLFGIGGTAVAGPVPEIGAVADALDAVRLPDPTEDHVVEALEQTAESALWWQPADASDALLERPELGSVLRRVAQWVAGSEVVQRLWSVEQDGARWVVTFDDDDDGAGAGRARPVVSDALRGWADDLRRDAAAGTDGRTSGAWWTTPPWPLVQTTGAPLASSGPLALWAVEDSFGQQHALVAPASPGRTLRVCIVDGPEDWAAVCRRWPLDVTGTTRRHDWGLATGRDGDWVVPDWSAVAREYDVVHLTVAGWLRTSGAVVAVDDTTASVVAGWTPDSAYWLTDPGPVLGTPEVWTRPGNAGPWRPRS